MTMRARFLTPGLVLVVVLSLSAYAWTRRDAAPPPDTVRYDVTGVVVAPPQGRTVSIAHDDIPGFMPGMTMPFTMGTGVDVGALRPGDRVQFVLQVGATATEAHTLTVTGSDAEVAARSDVRPTARAARLRKGDAVPAFSLRDQADAPLTSQAFEDRLTVVTFIFTRCPLPEFCPLMVKRFQELQRELDQDEALGHRTQLLSVTLDPGFDTPQVLHAYGTAMKADFTRWRFATGTEAAIAEVAKAFAVYTEWNGPSLDHTLATALIGPDGRVVEIWRGNGWTVDEVLAALRAADAS